MQPTWICLAYASNFSTFQVFSKLSEQRFPSELELQELIGSRIPDSQIVENLEKDLVLDDADADADDAMTD